MRVWLIPVLWGVAFGPLTSAKRPAFNDQEVPTSIADLQVIEKALKSHLERARAATVALVLEEGSGSAVIISPEGLVLTAAHVTAGVDEELTVVMEDGTEYPGRSLGLHSETDSAMFQIESDEVFPYVEIDRSESSELGDWVFALGHSGGFDQERGVNVRVGRLVMQESSTIQSDAMLIGGDSGGPLFNMAGEVIGIHSRVGSSKEDNRHVPIEEFFRHWDELKKGEFIGEGPFATRPVAGSGFLGARVEDADEEGLEVLELWEDGPAMEAGLEVGDVVMEIDGESASESLLAERMAALSEGDEISLKWRRGDEEKSAEIKLSVKP